MKSFFIILFSLAQIGASFGFYPELDFDIPDDSLEELGNILQEQRPRSGCKHHMEKAEAGGLKLIVRLKRMIVCTGGIQIG